MTERLLQFIWQFQYYNRNDLKTINGEALTITHPGAFNVNQGPDFTDARIKIEDTFWAGNIELHLRSSDWNKHLHSNDLNYDNIILHVVWQYDQEILDKNGRALSTLILNELVPKVLLDKYEWLMLSQDFVPCQKQLPALSDLGWLAWKERLAIERLQQKSTVVLQNLQQANNHWEEVFWWMLARNFGIKVNADIFEAIAKSISINILGRHKNQISQIEALLLGQAGLLQSNFDEDYPLMLQREYNFLKKKYNFSPLNRQPFFLRMRPANFPTIRLAQLAMLINQSSHLFSRIKECNTIDEARKLLNVTANDYWHYHYRFDEPVEFKPKQLGEQMTDNLIINTIIPVFFAYGLLKKDEDLKGKAVLWLQQIPPEKNNITNAWTSFGIKNSNALESQALIGLKNGYCNNKRCLECAVGNTLLQNKPHKVVST